MIFPNIDRDGAGFPLLATLALLGAALVPAAAATQAPAAVASPPAALAPEDAFVHKLPPLNPRWAIVRGGFDGGGSRIYDGDKGKMLGTISTSKWSDLALDPTGRYFFVSESIWTKVIRGTRQDLVAIYDTRELKLQSEIAMPGRLLIGSRINNFVVSDDGRTGYVYNLSPASSVNVIDLAGRRFVQTVELPGCASLMPNPGIGFSALCGDGSMATAAISGRSAKITRTEPFFAATDDPIFDNFQVNRARAEAVMLSYSGRIYQAKMGAQPKLAEPWSIQVAAGLRPGDTRPLDINWLPGGSQPMALHQASGTLYVLMHMGEFWSHKQPGSEIWQVDLAARKVLRRFPLPAPVGHVAVTQDAKPLLYVNEEDGKLVAYDALTFEKKTEIKDAGGGLIATPYVR